jgi:GH15 family glucan-1,4-alpha-glucosidase
MEMPPRIEDYALIGDCETAALVGRNGSIDWLCWPRFDSGACFAALLGTNENGRWQITAADENARITRKYRDNTLTLETHIETKDGSAVVIDFMPTKIRSSHIVRLVRGVRGRVDFRTQLIIRFDYGSVVPWVRRHKDGSLRAVAGPDMVVLRSKLRLEPKGRTHCAEFTVSAGETFDFTLSYNASFMPVLGAIDPEKALAQTERTWTIWSENFTGRCSPLSTTVMRSLLTLRGLIYQPSGGIVAAPTTSLPEKPGGTRNWDYRFCWLRDATFTLLALMNAGQLNEAKSWRKWLLRALAGEPSLVQTVYGINGERRLPEMSLPWLTGYGQSQPVRIGNAAAGQLQLDIFGEVIDLLYQSRIRGLIEDDDDWALQNELLKHLETIWDQPDEGIWEVRGGRRHFTHSKIMTWVAFDRAVKSIENFGLPGPLDHWRTLRQIIHAEICAKAYNAELGTFTQSYGSKELDASLLLIALVGFLPPEDKRVRGTIEAIERDLMADGFVRRYNSSTVADGLPPGEGAFLACSFWLVDNLILLGRHADANRMFERLVGLSNDLGLLAEEYDPSEKRLLGNFPQAFSHIALINTACNLTHAEKPAVQRSGALVP